MSITRQNLSIIIVSYKSEHVIEKCINSVDNQIEIIIIDNSNNPEFKKDIEKKYNNVKCILSTENLGMGAGNNLGIKNIKTDFAFILNPDVNLEKNSLDEILDASKNIDNFGILAPISSKNKYPNYELEKNTEFDPIKPFKVESVDGFAMVLNLKRLKKIDNFEFFDENFFMYLENDDLCKRLIKENELIYVVPKSKINHLGGEAVNPKYEKEIEYSRNWHWMWSKFYFNKKHYGYLIAFTKVLSNLTSAVIKFFYYLIIFNNHKKKIYQMRLLGLLNSMTGKKSFYRPRL
jgi:GT2 family glycosyltransferase